MKMKFNFFKDFPPKGKKKTALSAAALFAAGMATASESKLPEAPTTPSKEENKIAYTQTTPTQAPVYDFTKSKTEGGGDGLDDNLEEDIQDTPPPNMSEEDIEKIMGSDGYYPKDTLKTVVGKGWLLGKNRSYYEVIKAKKLNVSGPFVYSGIHKDFKNENKFEILTDTIYAERYFNTVDDEGNYCVYDFSEDGTAYLIRLTRDELKEFIFAKEIKTGRLYFAGFSNGSKGCKNFILPRKMEDALSSKKESKKRTTDDQEKVKVFRERMLRSETWPDNYVMVTYRLSNGQSQIECTRPLLDARGRMQYDANRNLVTEVIPYQVFIEHHTLNAPGIPYHINSNVVITNNY